MGAVLLRQRCLTFLNMNEIRSLCRITITFHFIKWYSFVRVASTTIATSMKKCSNQKSKFLEKTKKNIQSEMNSQTFSIEIVLSNQNQCKDVDDNDIIIFRCKWKRKIAMQTNVDIHTAIFSRDFKFQHHFAHIDTRKTNYSSNKTIWIFYWKNDSLEQQKTEKTVAVNIFPHFSFIAVNISLHIPLKLI